MIESLESRRMMANVTAVQRADGSVYVTGTAEADHLSIGPSVDFSAAIFAFDGTTINGRQGLVLDAYGASPIVFDLGDGDDTVGIGSSENWGGEVGILGGSGNDRVTVTATHDEFYVHHVYFAGGDGDDMLGITDRTVDEVIFEGGGGRDRAYLNNVVVRDRLNVVDRSGPTNLTAVDVAVARSLRFDTGNSLDRLDLERVKTKGALYVQTRGGGDTFYLIGRNRFASKQVELGDDPNDRWRVLP
ncbi:MAG: hypothetical protein JWM57_1301 [Phycisphaerales bacterium]|nr:hypothetical protein [Phycisphaerales bacterium]